MESCGTEEDCQATSESGIMEELDLLCDDVKMEGEVESQLTEDCDPVDGAETKISESDGIEEKHISIVRDFAELEELANITGAICTGENGRVQGTAAKIPCPLCPDGVFRACNAQKLNRHLLNLHWKISVEYEGYRMCICHLQCRRVKPNFEDQSNAKMGAHYHCIICSSTIFRRTDMVSHMKRHVTKGETKINFPSVLPAPPSAEPNVRSSEDILKEADTRFQVVPNYSTPQKTDSYFNPKMKSNRQLIFCALAVLAQERNPLECLDAFGSTGIMGLQWAKHLGSSIKVTINDINEKSVAMIRENCRLNKMKVLNKEDEEDEESEEAEDYLGAVEVTMLDANVLMHLRPFDFIHLDPFGTSVNYLDAAFRNVRNLGIVSVTSTDLSALYGKALSVTKRHYGCNIVRTEYFREMAARIVVAAMARAAARCNKGINVLLAVALEHFILVVVRVLRGPTEADESVKKIRTLIHCQWCEERIFKEGHMIGESPYQQLPCNCHESMPGKSAMELGPMWSGTIFNTGFVRRMLYESVQHGIEDIQPLLKTLICEAECTTHKQLSITLSQHSQEESGVIIITPDVSVDLTQIQGKRKRNELKNKAAKRRKSEAHVEHPSFYYSIHRHSIRGMNSPKLNKFLQYLSQAGFQVSRTHFDPLGIRTNATLQKFKTILEKHSTSANAVVAGTAAAASPSVPLPPADDVSSVELHAFSESNEFTDDQFLADDIEAL